MTESALEETVPASPWPDGALSLAEPATGPLRVVRLTHVDPLLPSHPDVLYDFTLPELTERTRAILRGQLRHKDGPYRGYRFGGTAAQSPEEESVPPYEATRLVAFVYARCLDPIQTQPSGSVGPIRGAILDGFARMLTTQKVLAALELAGRRLGTIRALDTYQPGLGTTTVRWLQYLARVALEADLVRSGGLPYAELRRLREALCTITHSITAVDRFAALVQSSGQ